MDLFFSRKEIPLKFSFFKGGIYFNRFNPSLEKGQGRFVCAVDAGIMRRISGQELFA
jgi:hypothetical protein